MSDTYTKAGPPLLPGTTAGGYFPPDPAARPAADPVPGRPSPRRPEPSAGGGDAEHNAAALKRLLADIGAGLHRGTDTINNLNRSNGTLVGQVASAGEFAVATEQAGKSKQALDETAGLTVGMDRHLGSMSSAMSSAEDAVSAAVAGIRVVDEAEDDLRQAGAGTKSVAPARDGA